MRQRTYKPLPLRKKEIPKEGGNKVRTLSIPAVRDRVVQGALKLIMEPIFEADFQSGSYGYRPKRTPHQAVERVMRGILLGKQHTIDLDLRAYLDSVRHDRLLNTVARRIQDDDILALLKKILKSSGSIGVPQGGIVSPLLSNIYRRKQPRHDRPIILVEKLTGKRSAGNPHAPFDEAGAGNGFTVRLMRHSQRKRGETDRPTYGAPRQSSTLLKGCLQRIEEQRMLQALTGNPRFTGRSRKK